jgi:hypothetical protein
MPTELKTILHFKERENGSEFGRAGKAGKL